MKSMRIVHPGEIHSHPLEMQDLPIPEPRADEILIKIRTCGVCHTDLHEAEGELKTTFYPITPGHQVVGIVEDVGKNVSTVKIGDRVGVPWLYSTCGYCDACRRGDENLCENAQFTGKDVNGGYAEYMVAKEGFTLNIPLSFSDLDATPLLCAGIIGFRAMGIAGVKQGEKIGLVGYGASAHIVLQLLNHIKCQSYIFTRAENHRKNAVELGAVWAGGIEDKTIKDLDRMIIFAPAGSLVQPSLGKTRTGGVVAINAVYMTPIPEMEYKWIYGERVLRTVANATRQDGIDFLAEAESMGIKVTTKQYALEDANQALQDLKEGKIVGEAVLKIS